MILQQLKKQNIKNILLFVSDSLRWDYTPKKIIEEGVTLKTIASSLYTAPSFPSIFSGLYPPKTGVYNWENILKKNLRGLFNFNGYKHSLWCETTWTNSPPWESDLHNVLGKPEGVPLEEIKIPFIYVENDKGGHCPYGISFGKYKSFQEFYREYGKKGNSELRKQYTLGVKESEKNLYKRIETLKERNLLDETLIIFTSDHGELLGEYGGLVGHGRPPCPELVYVPTIFIHPSLETQKITNNIIRHVDLFPTIASILNRPIQYQVDGVDLTKTQLPLNGLNFRIGGYFKAQRMIERWMDCNSTSMWNHDGGHIFQSLSRKRALILFLYKILIQHHPEFAYFYENVRSNSQNKFKDLLEILQKLTKPYIKYGEPQLTKNEAKKIISQKIIESKQFKEKMKINEAINRINLGKIRF